MGLTKVYDSASVAVVFNGALLSGFAPGSRVSIAFPEQFTKQVGSDGEVARSKVNDGTAQVKITLLQTSFSNDALSVFHNLDKSGPFGLGVGPLFIKDLQGTFLFAAPQAWIVKFADAEFAQDAGEREWTIDHGD